MSITRKQISFDLDTKILEKHYPNSNWRNAYKEIKIFMIDNGFSWQQGSVYISNKPIHNTSINELLENLVKLYPYLNNCMRDCVVTNIGKSYSLNHLFNKQVYIQSNINIDILSPNKTTIENEYIDLDLEI